MQPAVPPRMPSRPNYALPALSCDTHTHIFGSFDRLSMPHPPAYAPPDAPAELYLRMLDTVGTKRGIVVQPTPYGLDNRLLLEGLKLGSGSFRGIAVASPEVTDRELFGMRDVGVRGLRFSEMNLKGAVGFDGIRALGPRMKDLGWHAQLWAPAERIAGSLSHLVKLGIPLMVEHMGWLDIKRGVGAPEFQTIREFLAEGKIWCKLVLCRNSTSYPNYPDLRPFHDALVNANPEQVVWGSDWPFVRMGHNAPDVATLVDRFYEWVPSEALRQKILVDNPARFYQFSERNP